MSKRILVVEDEPAIADAISYALTTEGLDVVWRATGGEARTALEAGGIDFVVLDIGLPDCSGFDLCREIRESSNVPILFLTSRGDEIDRVVGLEIGADDYVVKPFSPRELSARVKAILRRAPDEEGRDDAEGTPASPFSVDAHRRRIAFFDEPLDLSR